MTSLNSWRRNVNFDTFGRFPGDEFMPDVLGATWDTELMRRIADWVLLLKGGKVIYSGAKEGVSESLIHDLYFSGDNHAE